VQIMHTNAEFSLLLQQYLVTGLRPDMHYATKSATIKHTSTSIKNSSTGLQYN